MHIGIDLGGSHISAGIVSDEGRIIYKESCSSVLDKTYQDYVKSMGNLCKKILEESGIGTSEIESVGIGSPGMTNNKKGTVTSISNIKFNEVPLREEFSKYFDVPINIDNDANCAALGEHLFGAAKGTNFSATATFGTGVGVGIIYENKILGGFGNGITEPGHNVIVSDGERCSCGRRGCWEAYASSNALMKEARVVLDSEGPFIESKILEIVEGDFAKITSAIVFQAAKDGDLIAGEVIHRYMKYLSEGVANIINILMPDIFIIGGGISNQGDYVLDMVKKRVYASIYTKSEPRTQIKIAELGPDAGLIGAAMLYKVY